MAQPCDQSVMPRHGCGVAHNRTGKTNHQHERVAANQCTDVRDHRNGVGRDRIVPQDRRAGYQREPVASAPQIASHHGRAGAGRRRRPHLRAVDDQHAHGQRTCTLQQIAELTAAGCDIVRVAVPSQDDADALPEICRKSPIPVIADIHFQSKYVFQAIDAGCAAVRVNPGNIRKFDEVGPDICKAATDAGISLRIGVNAGSLDKELYAKYGGPTPEALVASALKEAHMFEDVGFHDFKISVKHHDVITMVETYRLLASKGDWPLHLGVTEAGPAWQGTINPAWRSVRSWPRALATRFACLSPRRRPKRSRWVANSWNTWDCAPASSTSSPARAAAAPKWM